jgi:multiple sugar transport system substrate-binding protein
MTSKINPPPSGTGIGASRRTVLQGIGAAGLAAGFTVPAIGRLAAQETVTLRWWSPQSAPAQLEAYQAQIASFEAANPGVKVVFEPTSDEGYPAQFAAAFASKQLPHVVTHLPSFAAQTYYAQGLLEPFDDVIQTIGADKYYPGANDVYKAPDGKHVGTALGTAAANMLWVRTDLLEKAGIARSRRPGTNSGRPARRCRRGASTARPCPTA